MPRLFVVYFTWPNTAANHSGMAHLVKELHHAEPQAICPIEIPPGINGWARWRQRLYFYKLAVFLRWRMKPKDSLLLMEYLGNVSGNQTGLALKLRSWGMIQLFYGLVHLSGNNLLELYGSDQYLKQGLEAVDKVLVFGSSLERFIADLGFGNKVLRTFHYVDDEYYKPAAASKPQRLQVLHMGSIKRNFAQLHDIVKRCPELDFQICQGHADLKAQFSGFSNVTLYGYLSEPELLSLMQRCHISLSVLEDTIGSNVITTSMACGLVNVVSDVGSIRDYCDDTNAVLCSSSEEFAGQLRGLDQDRTTLFNLQANAIKKAASLNLGSFINWMRSQRLIPHAV